MSKVGQIERATQNRLKGLFKNELGYKFIGNLADKDDNSNIFEGRLKSYLIKKGYDESLVKKAVEEFVKTANDQSKPFYDVNKAVYSMLRYGVSVTPDVGQNNVTVWLIDWKDPLANDFAIAEEVTING